MSSKKIKGAYLLLGTILCVELILITVQKQNLGSKVLGIDFSQGWSFNFNDNTPGSQDKFSDTELEHAIKDTLSSTEGQFAVVVESLNSKDHYAYYNAKTILKSGSLYKLFLLGAVYQEIEAGRLKETDTIEANLAHLDQELEGRDFGYEDYDDQTVIKYTVLEAVTRVTTISDNNAALMLAEKVGWERVQKLAQDLGANGTVIKSPISTTAADIALFYRKLYQASSFNPDKEPEEQFLNPSSADKIIKLLSQAKINNRIPEKLPEGLKIAHKTGELARLRHDAGIVFLEGKPYLIVLMAQDLQYEDDGVETLAEVSERVYHYFATR